MRQLTFAPYGHTLNRRQSVSPCSEWIAYDTRNDDTFLARTSRIEMVHVDTSEIICLYDTDSRNEFGPGVGAVAFHPSEKKVVFIHGLRSCSATAPYSGARRFGAVLDIARPGVVQYAESRCMSDEPAWQLPFGWTSGGTHAHCWNDRSYISFTYNDIRLERAAQKNSAVQDLRTIGFMLPGAPPCDDIALQGFSRQKDETFLGTYSAFVAANVRAHPLPGSDEISAALEECWVGELGYEDLNGNRLANALAFQGTLLDEKGMSCREVFVTDIPSEEDLVKAKSLASSQPSNMDSDNSVQHFVCKQRRLTHTQSRPYPGISGPRHWLASSKSGNRVYCLMRDDRGIVQLHFVSILGGDAVQVTDLPKSIDSQFSLNSSTTKAAFLCDNRVVEADLETGACHWLTERDDSIELIGSVQYLRDDRWICNGTVLQKGEKFIQIFVVE